MHRLPRILLSILLITVFWSEPVPGSSAENSFYLAATESMDAGNAAFTRGRFVEAVKSWQAGASLFEKANDSVGKMDALCLLADAYKVMGYYQLAIETLQEALKVSTSINDMARQALIRGNLGGLYVLIDNPASAKEYLDAALATAKNLDHPGLLANLANTLGNYFSQARAYDQALAAYQQCLSLAGQIKDEMLTIKARINLAEARINLAEARINCKDYPQAATHLESALASTANLAASHDKAQLLILIGKLYMQLKLEGHLPQQEPHAVSLSFTVLKSAADLAETINDQRSLSYANGYLGQMYEHANRVDEALYYTRRAVFAAQQAQSPEIVYLWQWQTGRLLKSRQDIDGAILAMQQAIFSLQVIRDDLALDCKRGNRLSFHETVGPVYFSLADYLLRRSKTLWDSDQVQQDLHEAVNTLEQLNTVEVQDYFQDNCVTTLRSKALSLDQITGQTAVIYQLVLPERTELLIALGGRLQQHTVPVGSNQLTEIANQLRRKLEQPASQFEQEAKLLYDWLIKPFENELYKYQINTLVFVPDRMLRTIPVAALHDGEQFLISKFAVVVTPGLAMTYPSPLIREDLQVLLSGLTVSAQGFTALPKVAEELDGIKQSFDGTELRDQDFTVRQVENTLNKNRYSIVHIASHGQFDMDPQKTFLLAYDEKITMNKLEKLLSANRVRQEPIELLTLSACQTAVGDNRAALGLAGVALKAGVRSAIASLWFIDDAASAMLITEFYRQLRDPALSKAQALQKAQLKLMTDERYRHPAFWAPFLVIGNWS